MTITLIFTRHNEDGACNSNILHEIIEKISPEVIFEELSYTTYDEIYEKECQTTLESNAVKKYLQNHDIEHIPVDTYDLPEHYYRNMDYMLNRIFNSIGADSYELKGLMDSQVSQVRRNGFNFLNSDQNDDLIEKMTLLKEKILRHINDEKLFETYRLNEKVIDGREHEILDNIYNYSKGRKYNRAVMFIGSGHRNSIIEKIENRRRQGELEIEWIYYDS